MKQAGTAICIVLSLMLSWAGTSAPPGAAPEFPDEARRAMFGFLKAWLVQQDKARTMGHFSASGDALMLAPRAVLEAPGDLRNGLSEQQRDGYWEVLNRLGVPSSDVSLEEVLAPIDPDLKAALEHELGVNVVFQEPFTVFVADKEIAVDSFDGGYGDVATVLRPATGNPVLTMIADFAQRHHASYVGPFVSFWRADLDEAWRIHALGGAPEGEVWRDGYASPALVSRHEPGGRD